MLEWMQWRLLFSEYPHCDRIHDGFGRDMLVEEEDWN